MDDGWQWSVVSEHWPLVRTGVIVSIVLTLISIVAGSVLGAILGLIVTGARGVLRPIAWIVLAWIEVLQALPVLVVLVWLHFALPESSSWLHDLLVRFNNSVGAQAGNVEQEVLAAAAQPAFATAVVGLTIGLSARIANSIRRGAATIPIPLVDVAKSQGMNALTRLRRVIAPATFRASVAEIGRSYVTTFKLTTLAAFIGCSELLLVTYDAVRTGGHALELLTMVAFIFLVLALPSSWLISALERSRWLRRSVSRESA